MRAINREALLSAIIMSFSGLIVLCFYRYFQWSAGDWAVISVAAVTQARVNNTLKKIVLRVIGTLLGAIVAYYLVVLLPATFLLPLFCIGLFVCLLCTLAITEYRYVMIMTGLTFTLVIASGLTHSVEQMAWIRTCEVIFGCLICSLVSLLVGYFVPDMTGDKSKIRFRFVFYPRMIFDALMMSFACGLTFFTWQWLHYPLGFWATVSCLFVLEENIGKTIQNGVRRVKAHVLVACFAGLIAFWVSASSDWIILPVVIGLFLCGYCLGLKSWLSEIANTMAIALTVMLLVDAPGLSQIDIVFARFLNVIYGVSVAFFVMYLTRARKAVLD